MSTEPNGEIPEFIQTVRQYLAGGDGDNATLLKECDHADEVWNRHIEQHQRAVAAGYNAAAAQRRAVKLAEALQSIVRDGKHHFNDNNGWRPILTVQQYERARAALHDTGIE